MPLDLKVYSIPGVFVRVDWSLSDQLLWKKPLGLSLNAISCDFMSLLVLRERHRKAGGEDEERLLKHFGRRKSHQGISKHRNGILI